MYSRKTENKYLLRFVDQIGVLRNTIKNRVDAYPLSSGYLNESHAGGLSVLCALDNQGVRLVHQISKTFA